MSGLFDKVEGCCNKAGLGVPHTIEYSLGTWGDTEKMAPWRELEVMTMCGHAQIPGQLVRHMAERGQGGPDQRRGGGEEAGPPVHLRRLQHRQGRGAGHRHGRPGIS